MDKKKIEDQKTKHHLFTYKEVKSQLEKMYDILGRNKNDLNQRSQYLWTKIPTIELSKKEHTKYHNALDGQRPEEKKKRDEFFRKFHQEIADELGLREGQVEAIRSAVLGRGETVKEFGLRMFDRAKLPKHGQENRSFSTSRRNSKEWHLEVYRFIENITKDQMSILLKLSYE